MSLVEAPLYLRCHDLALRLVRATHGWRGRVEIELGSRVARSALDLLEAIAVALSFPGARKRAQHRADEALVSLRVALRLARELSMLSSRQQRFAFERIDTIGRMLGGWRRRAQNDPKRAEPTGGEDALL